MRRMPAFLPLVVLCLSSGIGACGSESVPTAPAGAPSTPPPQLPLTVSSVQPSAPFAGNGVTVFGTGFLSGAQVRLGALPALASVEASSRIIVTTPIGGGGTVDVVVTNPNGQSVTLPAGLTYNAVTLSLSRTLFAPGEEVTVTWSAVATRCALDWIGMYKLGEPNANYGPWDYTTCGTGGVVRLIAPAMTGHYEFRYLPNDDYQDVAKSVTVTVE